MFSPLYELLNDELSDDDAPETVADIVEQIHGVSFQRWYRAKEFTANVRNGQSYFNGPSSPPDPLRHTPSQLLQCSRKIYYRERNAPKETADPSGIFWVGEHVETDLIVPYFQSITDDNVFVQNSIWIDFEIESSTGDLRLKGETDPVFVDKDGTPLLVTEIKTKDSVEHLNSPNDHHLAQAHAYMYGLTQKFDYRLTDALLVYVSRSTLDLKAFSVEFDPFFWRDRVLSWAATHSEHRIEDQLPPADPEFGWECQFCSYRERCGKETDGNIANSPPRGFVPVHEYSEEAVTMHIEAHGENGVQLTPTVANQFPELADGVGVYDWRCQSCDETFEWGSLEPSQTGEPVPCPACESESTDVGSVRGPTPEEQVLINDE